MHYKVQPTSDVELKLQGQTNEVALAVGSTTSVDSSMNILSVSDIDKATCFVNVDAALSRVCCGTIGGIGDCLEAD